MFLDLRHDLLTFTVIVVGGRLKTFVGTVFLRSAQKESPNYSFPVFVSFELGVNWSRAGFGV